MEKNIILIHAGLAVVLVLYLFVRLMISLFGLKDQSYLAKVRKRFRRADWFLAIFIGLSGLYPIIILGQLELYHIIKCAVLLLFIILSRYSVKINFALATLLTIVLVMAAGTVSFLDQPTFPKEKSSFSESHREIVDLTPAEKGAFIFGTLCTQCHGIDGKKGLFGAADLSVSKLSLDEKMGIIKKGSPLTVMRSFSNELSEEEIRLVAQYIHQFSR